MQGSLDTWTRRYIVHVLSQDGQDIFLNFVSAWRLKLTASARLSEMGIPSGPTFKCELLICGNHIEQGYVNS